MKDGVRAAVLDFFDEFVKAFRTFDGKVIAQRFLSPYLAAHTDGTSDCFAQPAEIASYVQKIVDEYHAKGCRSCRYSDLEVVSMGEARVLGTVTWELLHEDGSVLSRWRESYNLARGGAGLKVFCSVDHAG
ncbi:MAG TPA: hypothetical protein PKD86_09345 [Gemmatales bacterium]|nr:hypothetical protein [Gemmatales bacterium]HMP59544.1 hypothetical protein [Gemmatales bacterium]